MSENSIINVAKSNSYHYVGNLKADPSLPSRMIANFPLSKLLFEISLINYRWPDLD